MAERVAVDGSVFGLFGLKAASDYQAIDGADGDGFGFHLGSLR